MEATRGNGYNRATIVPPSGPSSPSTSSQLAAQPTISSSRNASQRQIQDPLMAVSHWQGHRGLEVLLDRVPPDVTTKDIWTSFPDQNLVFIEILESRTGARTGRVRLQIEPPPKVNPWLSGRCLIHRENLGNVEVRIKVDKLIRNDLTFSSPSNRNIPFRSTINLSSIRFGRLVKESAMMEMRRIESCQSLGGLEVMMDFKKRNVQIDFSIKGARPLKKDEEPRPPSPYRICFRFSSIKEISRKTLDTGGYGILLEMPFPPQLLKKTDNIDEFHSPEKLTWADNDMWYRQTGLVADPSAMKHLPLKLNVEQFIDIGRWTTYYLEVDPQFRDQWDQVEQALEDYNMKTQLLSGFSLVDPWPATYWSLIVGVSEHHTSSQALAFLFNPSTVVLSFDVRYQMEVCLSKGLFNEYNIDYGFLERLASLTNDRAKMMLEDVVERRKPVYTPMDMFENSRVLEHYSFSKVPSYCTLMRRAVVTPTAVYFSTPTVEVTNRVLRRYSDIADRFMRVQFTDELSDGRIRASVGSRKEDLLLTRVYRTLKNGIIVADRHYEFLAFGNSQIRENGAYFFCPTNHVTCDKIRKWMGSFEDIRCVAKYSARMGQCFSTTRSLQGYNKPNIVKIPDVERNGYCFTDGVGKISNFIAEVIAENFDLDEPPAVFQFRMGGCKGVLTRWPDVGHSDVHIRKSQEKFNAIHNNIEIVKWSKYAVATLNRQTIPVLSALGVEDSVFRSMLSRQLRDYDEAMKNKVTAMDLLGRYIDPNETTMIIARMIMNGFMDAHEPFVWSLLRLWKTWSVKALKEKARIVVEKSAFVLGCVDETGTLRGHTDAMYEAGMIDRSLLPQIFLQVPDPKDRRDYQIIKGICLVGRNPSLHPGDLRVVEAVDVLELRHIKDAVVFSQNGDRDVPSMCSGGDLDGDDFFVFWDENLIPREWNYPPMTYTPPKPDVLNRDVNINDIIQFFVLYMKNDSLPHIAHAHLAQADWLEGGEDGESSHVKHPKCLELAALHSKAVDYVKSGVPAQMPRHLHPRHWPHFMEKRKRFYRSTQVLGQLYDMVRTISFEPAYEMPFDKRILEHYDLDNDILRKARQVKTAYDTALRKLMAQNEVETEFEAWSAFVLTKPRVGNDYKRQEDIGRESGALKHRFTTLCMEAAGIMNRARDPETLYPFVVAMYQVTNEEVQIARYESKITRIDEGGNVCVRKPSPESMPLISFPWLFHRELGHIVKGKVVRFTFGNYNLDSVEAKPPTHERRESLSADDIKIMEYVRTGDGRVFHRGEMLSIFSTGEDDFVPILAGEAETSRLQEAMGAGEAGSGRNTAHALGEDLLHVAANMPLPPDPVEGVALGDALGHVPAPSVTPTAAHREHNGDEGGFAEVEIELEGEVEEETALERAIRLMAV